MFRGQAYISRKEINVCVTLLRNFNVETQISCLISRALILTKKLFQDLLRFRITLYKH